MEELVIELMCLVQVFLLHLMPYTAVLAVGASVHTRFRLSPDYRKQGWRLTVLGKEKLVDDNIVCVNLVRRQFLDQALGLVQ